MPTLKTPKNPVVFALLRSLSLLVCFHVLLTTTGAASKTVRVSNSYLQVGINSENGNVVELIDVQTQQNQIDGGQKQIPLWEVEVISQTNHTLLNSAQANSFHIENLPDRSQGFLLIWEKFSLPAAPALKIEATFQMEPASASSQWKIAIKDHGDLVLHTVHFPRIGGLQKRENEFLAVPAWLGQQAANPRNLLADKRLEWDYPGYLSLQCLAFYQANGPGFYAACNDTAALRKSFAFWGDKSGNVNYEMVHYPENPGTTGKNYSPAYASVVGTFEGDWVTAAERYRAWGTNQVWAKESRLQKKSVPKWVLETGMWVWNRGRSENVLTPAVALQKELKLPVSVFWHWWHGCAYDTGFPEYLPPREGSEPFKRAVKQAHKKDVHAIVYMNQRLWGMTTKSWTNEGAEYFAVKNSSGKVQPEVYNVFTKQPCASMCMDTSFWRNKYAGLAEEALKDLKIDGIYMDQACSSLACYDSNHGHSLGGGAYWMDGFRKLSTDIRNRCSNKTEVALAGEGCGEGWLPYLDIMLALQVARERYHSPKDGWEVIPFFSAVYHPYAILYGNYSSLTMPPYDNLWPAEFAPKEPLKLLDQKYSRQFYLEQARAFVWGQQPTIASFLPTHLKERPEETEYMMRLAKIRSRAKKFLLQGTFLRPPIIDAPRETLDLSRLSIYAGQKGGITSSQGEYPLVIAGSWRSADGNVGIALASIADNPLEIKINLDAKDYPAKGRGTIYRIDEKGRKRIGHWNKEDRGISITLSNRDACLIEFSAR